MRIAASGAGTCIRLPLVEVACGSVALSLLASRFSYARPVGYVGCMKTGQIFTNPELRWYEPQHVLLGSKSYFAHAWGTAYVLSGRMAAFLATLPPDALRFFMNEGASYVPGTVAQLCTNDSA